MTDDFRIEIPFESRPPRLKDLINKEPFFLRVDEKNLRLDEFSYIKLI